MWAVKAHECYECGESSFLYTFDKKEDAEAFATYYREKYPYSYYVFSYDPPMHNVDWKEYA